MLADIQSTLFQALSNEDLGSGSRALPLTPVSEGLPADSGIRDGFPVKEVSEASIVRKDVNGAVVESLKGAYDNQASRCLISLRFGVDNGSSESLGSL